ncbi:MAG: hypothetical protein MJ085_05965 [Clostridia bacterium]|nr:hypothetical protein [Clostridia bacterium]
MEKNARERYADLIDQPHHVSKKHPQMSNRDRAAQFAPFAALSGYDSVINKTAQGVMSEEEDNQMIAFSAQE